MLTVRPDGLQGRQDGNKIGNNERSEVFGISIIKSLQVKVCILM
jgi:hypothetical protein